MISKTWLDTLAVCSSINMSKKSVKHLNNIFEYDVFLAY